ncbi:hypothetical protein CDV55_102667 [Aspergillus turcosus]|nr:hypothetical protein CDV55_102667 [Aspergillus turcosus]
MYKPISVGTCSVNIVFSVVTLLVNILFSFSFFFLSQTRLDLLDLMFLNGQGGQRPPTVASPPLNIRGSISTESSGLGRSRNNSDAMDIYAITDRGPAAERDPAAGHQHANGSPSISSTSSKYITLSLPLPAFIFLISLL